MFAQGNPLLALSDFIKDEHNVDSEWSVDRFDAKAHLGLTSCRPCSFRLEDGALIAIISMGEVQSPAVPHLLEVLESRIGGGFVVTDERTIEWQVGYQLEQLDELGWTVEYFYGALDESILYIESAFLLRERYPMRSFEQMLLPVDHRFVGRG